MDKKTPEDKSAFLSLRHKSKIVGICVLAFCLLSGGLIYNYETNTRPFEEYMKCSYSLNEVRNGLELYKSKGGVLTRVDSYADVFCNLIRGFDKDKNCRGEVKKFVEHSDQCDTDSFQIKIIDNNKYEIHGKIRVNNKCDICLTEISDDMDMRSKVRRCKMNPKPECLH